MEQSAGFIRRFRAYPRNPVLNASAEGLEEASYLAGRLQEYFKTEENLTEAVASVSWLWMACIGFRVTAWGRRPSMR